jgi:type IV pilus assembly protein PilA
MKNRKGFTLIELMIVIAIIGILAAMAIPNFKKARQSAREKACYSNIRVILGAVEMYNMDNSQMITTIADGDTTTSTGKLKGYLKAVSHPETQCSYHGTGLGDGNGGIYCSYHGDVDGNLGQKGSIVRN